MRPVLPRISSQASGFFFCGIRLLPVEYSSGRSRNPNSGEAKSTMSSESRERCIASAESAKRYSSAKSRSLDRVQAVRRDARETQVAAPAPCGRAEMRSPPARPSPAGKRRRERRRRRTRSSRARKPRHAPAASAKAASAARAACACCPAIGTPRFFSACAANARQQPGDGAAHLRARPLARTCGIRSPPFRCGCGRCAAWRRADRVFRSAPFQRNDGRPRPSKRRARLDRCARAVRFRRARRRFAALHRP